jgi:hypothetical protein
VPTAQELRVSLEAEQFTLLRGDARSERPFFLKLDAGSAANAVRQAAVVFDPENTLGLTQGPSQVMGFEFYRFDPDDVICPGPRRVRSPVQAPEASP